MVLWWWWRPLVVEEGREWLAIARIAEDRDDGHGGQTRRGELLELRGEVGRGQRRVERSMESSEGSGEAYI